MWAITLFPRGFDQVDTLAVFMARFLPARFHRV